MTISYHLEDIQQVARQILAASNYNTFIINAPMGAGKTTLITAMCKELGVEEVISSPTFAIVNEYKGRDQEIFHFDLYRLNDQEELFNIGIEEYIDKDAYLFFEWPELVTPHLQNFTELSIEILDSQQRRVIIKN